jgi:dihydroorotate dehydrogenase
MGFNNHGLAAMAERLAHRRRAGIVGANLGKNKDTEDAAADYEQGARGLGALADYLVINVSSPNTPGLRALQGREPLAELIGRTRRALASLAVVAPPPLLLKIAPDLGEEDRRDIAEVALAAGLDGLIVSNTTLSRPDTLASRNRSETGGLSGRPLFSLSTAMLADMYRLTGGKLPLIGSGGIASAADAYAKIRAGASLVQVYSELIYQGMALVPRINRGLADLLRANHFTHLADAVGADHRSSR